MQHIGTYVVERELGRGATGTVYLARTRAGRAVAVKVMRPGTGGDATAGDRVRAAVEAARRVGGFHTAPVLDAGTEGDAVWFATAYEPAPSLEELLKTRGPLHGEELHRLGTGLADALQSVHGCGLVHGGLKPSDVLMADDGPRVRDFALRAASVGSPPTDVHALGTVLVTAAGGDLPHLPEALRGIVRSSLDAEEHRRPDADALVEAFHRLGVSGGPGQAGPVPAAPPASPYGVPPQPAAPPAPPAGQHSGPYAPPPQAPVAHAPAPPPQGAFGPAPAPPSASPPTPGPAGALPGAPPTSVAHGVPAPGVPTPGPFPAQPPEFLAMDRRNDMVADAHGISFTAHGHHTDLAWPHIRFVQHRRDVQGATYHLTVSMVLANGTQQACRVSSRNAEEVDQWATQLDTVLAYFMPRLPQ